jgi:dTDP-glucose 4,6-dehydratase
MGSNSDIIVKGAPRVGEEPSVYVPSIERARSELGLEVKVSLEDAIKFSVK